MKRLECGVLDTSALVSVLYGEPGEEAFLEGFLRCDRLLVCAGTLAEISVVLLYDRDQAGVDHLDDLLRRVGAEIVPLSVERMALFRDGYARFGKGRNPAGLNLGDAFSYSLSKYLDAPLFFHGLDFAKTDIKPAMHLLGYPISRKGVPSLPRAVRGR